MKAIDWQPEEFEQHRGHLRAVAYRMLGSPAEADDAVQETWLRVSRTDADMVQNMRGWLTTIISRICLDMLRARRARREELVGDWVPGFDVAADPSEEAMTADAVGVALLIVLDALAPAERLAFVLHDMFGMSFEEIAPIVDRNPAATRQLASRARRRVRGARPPAASENLAAQRQVVNAFLRASREGDFDGLVAVLDSDVVLRTNRDVTGALRPSEYAGRELVAARVIERGRRFAHLAQPILVSGRAGLAVVMKGRLLSVISFTVEGEKVRRLDLFVYPSTRQRWG
jgi:RNA polymerase sigma factor (sigma-70 family)